MSDETNAANAVTVEYKDVGVKSMEQIQPLMSVGGMPPGYRTGQKGTTIYKPKREDKEVEAILGEKKYAPKAVYDRNAELETQNRSQQEQIKELQGQMQVMLAALAKTPSVKESVKTVEPPEPKATRTRKKTA